MTDEVRVCKPSAARSLVTALARFGRDFRPSLRHFRDAMLRPVRGELAAQQAEHDARHAVLLRQISELSARQTALDGVVARQADIARLQQQIAEIFARQTAMDDEAAKQADIARLQQQIAEISAHQTAIDDGAARQADMRRLEQQISELAARQAGDRNDLRARAMLLERLVTEPPRLPLAIAVRRIGEMPSPVVSVILPTRNRAHSIADAIISVQAQDFTDWELIVVDDGSDDDTAAVVRPYLVDPRVRYVEQPAAGASAARNQGLNNARGALIAYLDSDNVWYPGFLTAAVNQFAADPTVDVVYGVLVTEDHGLDATRLLWQPFDRNRLLANNYIDMNVIAHRKSLVERYGGFDERLSCLNDWDLLLRYTEHAPAYALPVLAARYRVVDDHRITTTVPFGPELFAIRRKWFPVVEAARRPRVLYALWQYPQLSETYIEGEIGCMRRLGAHVEVWREEKPASAHPASVPIHDGPLADAVRRVQPDVIHVHWIGFAEKAAAALGQLGIPVTVRVHGFDTNADRIRALLAQPWLLAIYGFPRHLALIDGHDPRLRAVPAAFDTRLFRPHGEKDRRLVLRAAACLPSKDLPLFFELANRLPEFRFVLAAITCSHGERYVEEQRGIHRQMNSRCELMFDLQREEMAALMKQAGIYVHTARPPGTQHGTPIGMPISIAEAMATGAYVLVRDLPELRDYVGKAGAAYGDVERAAEIIASTTGWSDRTWRKAWKASIDRAFVFHADETALRPIFDDWCAVARDRPGQIRAGVG